MKRSQIITFSLVWVMFMSALHINAQQTNVIRGIVTDYANNEPLPGVTILEKDKDDRIVNGAVTDINGSYQIRVNASTDSLHFSLLGMNTVSVAIGSRTTINVSLREDTQILGEVVIVAERPANLGGFFTPIDRTSAVSIVNMENLMNIPVMSLDQMLEGQVPGLMISMNSGNPGSGSSIQIRGAASLGLGTKPLIVVDDVPFRTEEAVDVNNPEGLSELVNISPSDIETINILKDAAATSLYGSDGANGVIVITTKRGDNIKPRVNVTAQFTLKYPQKTLPLLNGDQYKTMILESYQNRYGVGLDILNSPIRDLFLEKGDYNYENYNNNTYWPETINMKQGFAHQYSGSIIGGGESAKYNISLGYMDETGPVVGTNFNRLSGRFNFDYKISNNLTINSDVAYVNSKKKNGWGSVGSIVNIKAPVMPIYTQDSYGNSLSTYFFPGSSGFQGDVMNPVALTDLSIVNNSNDRLDTKVQIRFSPVKGLQINGLVSGAFEGIASDQFLPHSATGANYYRENNMRLVIEGNVNQSSMEKKNAFTLYAKNDIIYRFDFMEKHQFVAGLYNIFRDVGTNMMNMASTNIPNEKVSNPYLTEIINSASAERTIYREISNIGQLYYIYLDRYSLQGTINREGNSVFGSQNRFGYFPSISGFWRPLSEPFLKDKFKFWDELKIRASYGITGRSPGSSVGTSNFLTYTANAPFIDLMGVTPDNIKLENLRWEQSTTSNLGVDIGLFNGRFTITGDIASTTTKDLIMNAPVPFTSGFESMLQNYGTISGKSYEAEITAIPVQTKRWEFFVSFNISKFKAKVIALPHDEPVVRDKDLANGRFMSLVNVGDAIGTIYGLKYTGVYSTDDETMVKDANGQNIVNLDGETVPYRFSSPTGYIFEAGDARYADLNGDGVIDSRDVAAIGNNNPDFFGGSILRLRYKRTWELMANFIYQYGFDVINETKMNTTNMYSHNNQSTAALRRWRKQGDVTDIPRALYNAGYNWVGSDRYVEDGSYLKFQTLSLSYTLQRELLDKLNLQYARIALAIYNCGILTKYSGVDPTISSNRNDPFDFGKDRSMTPQPITYTLSVWVNF